MIAAIILAAGASERMGVPKADLEYRGRTFLQSVLEVSEAAGLWPRCVVLSQNHPIALLDTALRGVLVVRNPDVASGPIGSAILGVRTVLNHPVDAALVWHVDRPHVQVATIQMLADRFRVDRPSIVIPTFGERRGHPIVLGRDVFPEVLANPDGGLRTVVHSDPTRVATVAVDDQAILEDIDTPEDYEALLRGRTRR